MHLDSFDAQEIALALARALEGSPIPRETVPGEDQRNLFVTLKGSDGSTVNPIRIGEKLLRELDRRGYSIVRQR